MNRFFATCICIVVLAASVASGQTSYSIGLVVNSGASNPFGGYISEILKAEGFKDMQNQSLDGVTLSKLQSYQTVILSETTLTTPQAQIFRDYVSDGGNLIAMRPDSKLDDVFGISRAGGSVSEGYIKISSSTPIGTGLETSTSMKMHGRADRYHLATGATKVASLYSSGASDTGYASVVGSSYGSGQAVAFAYDLAKSIVYQRQGNPNWANQERDTWEGVRPADLFYNAPTHWNDITRADILQADEQMRLLSHSIEAINASQTPLPRLWYFPNAKKSVLVFTGDQDGASVTDVMDELNTVQAHGGTGSMYLLGPRPSQAQFDSLISAGHEIGVHVDDIAERTSPTWAGMDNAYDTQFDTFDADYPNAPPQESMRNHYIVWSGKTAENQLEFAAQAQIGQNHGIGVDFNYYFFDSSFQGTSGHTIPSGLPMHFAMSTGEILDIYQADTQVTDEGWGSQSDEKYAELLNASLNQDKYSWIVANFHPYAWGSYADEAEAILDLAVANGIPIWSGAKMNSFLEMRDAADFQDIAWDGQVLSFLVNSPVSGEGALTAMVPYDFNGEMLNEILLDGSSTGYSVETIAGTDYALFLIGNGTSSINAHYVPELQADFDQDGDVDGDDFLTWQAAFNNNANGDADADGDTDGDDFLLWQQQFGSGTGSGSSATAVPEPASMLLLATALTGLALTRRRLD